MDLISYRWKHRILLFQFYSFVAIALLSPIAADTFIPGIADYINHLAGIMQANMALTEGQFPIRIAPLEHTGWRYPLFQFYSPTTYTFAGAIYHWLTPSNPLIAYKITLWIALVAGGMYMNRLAYWFIKSGPAAILASMVYLASPYYIIVINNLGDLSEIIALGILPATIFYSLQYYFHPNENKTLLKLGLIWYLLITTHVVTYVYTSLFIAILLLLITLKNRRHWKNLIHVGIGYAAGILLAMWYLAPVGLLGKYVIVSQTFTTPATFMFYNPVISQLFSPAGSEFHTNLVDNHPAIGWLILFGAGICIYALVNKLKINHKRANYWLPFLLITFFIALILTWSPFNFWRWLPNIFLIGQYSWRFLEQVIWIGALLFAWAVCWLFKNKLDRRHTIIGILFIVIATSVWFPTIERSKINLEDFKKNPSLVYNSNAFTLNFNKHTQFVGTIDNMSLYLLAPQKLLQLNTPYSLPRSLLVLANQPFISLEGVIPENMADDPELSAVINGVVIAKHTLQPGTFNWDIPLNSVLKQFNQAATLVLQFKIDSLKNNKKIQSPLEISINKIILSGFLNPLETLTVNQVQPNCHLLNTVTICKINASKTTQLIELPILYYPQLLKIMVNGKSVPYRSVLYKDHLITGVTPEPGKMNTIQIQFRGLQWANIVSWISWSVWLVMLIILLLRSIRWPRFVKM